MSDGCHNNTDMLVLAARQVGGREGVKLPRANAGQPHFRAVMLMELLCSAFQLCDGMQLLYASVPGVSFTALFNNMRTLKFKAQPTNVFFATVNQMVRRLLPASDYSRARGNQIKSLSTVKTTYSEAGRSRRTFD